MSARTGRPTDDPKRLRFELVLSESDMEKLEYAAEVYGLTKAEIFRWGMKAIYLQAQKEAQKQNEVQK